MKSSGVWPLFVAVPPGFVILRSAPGWYCCFCVTTTTHRSSIWERGDDGLSTHHTTLLHTTGTKDVS
uniref:Putative secreted protein n=1 Tax=Anopheles darlingi TaxID=43151 RepID=A0A2M4DF77_ANODA